MVKRKSFLKITGKYLKKNGGYGSRMSEISGAATPGYSSGQAIEAMEEVAAEVLGEGWGFEWTTIAST